MVRNSLTFSMNTITFSKKALAEIKAKHDDAVANKQSCFVWKANLVDTHRAGKFIKRLENAFNDAILADTITIPSD